ncbi:MAG TPA: hypothetical protein VJ184_05170 [Chryseolinea sp.]|nr:hypothetical protein [Chryseolinea sp.]
MRTSFYDWVYAGLVLVVFGMTLISGLEYKNFKGENGAGLYVSLSVIEIVIPSILILLSVPTYYLFKRQLRKRTMVPQKGKQS